MVVVTDDIIAELQSGGVDNHLRDWINEARNDGARVVNSNITLTAQDYIDASLDPGSKIFDRLARADDIVKQHLQEVLDGGTLYFNPAKSRKIQPVIGYLQV